MYRGPRRLPRLSSTDERSTDAATNVAYTREEAARTIFVRSSSFALERRTYGRTVDGGDSVRLKNVVVAVLVVVVAVVFYKREP